MLLCSGNNIFLDVVKHVSYCISYPVWHMPQVGWGYGMKTQFQWILGIRTLHDCPSQMNENLLISNSKLTSDSELIWWR